MTSSSIQYTRRGYVSIAGHNVIYNLWKQRGYQIKTGWKITSDEFLHYLLKSDDNYGKYSVIIDSAPSLKDIVDLKELHDIHLFTYVNEDNKKVDWSVICLRVRDIYYKNNLNAMEKVTLTNQFIPDGKRSNLVCCFLYIHGDKRGWNWGRLGQMNGAWLYPDARNYFQQIMNE